VWGGIGGGPEGNYVGRATYDLISSGTDTPRRKQLSMSWSWQIGDDIYATESILVNVGVKDNGGFYGGGYLNIETYDGWALRAAHLQRREFFLPQRVLMVWDCRQRLRQWSVSSEFVRIVCCLENVG
jgi:hypothetical protein